MARSNEVPLVNWTVPPYRVPSSPGALSPMSDISPGVAFVGITVCRLLDTRPPINNPLDGDGKYGTDETRTYTIPLNCGIPSGTEAVSLNFTVTETDPNPFGFVKVWPADQSEPNVSTLNWSASGVTESNAAIVPLSSADQIKVKTGNAGAHVIIDVNGYFTDEYNAGHTFVARSATSTPAILAYNSSTAAFADAIYGELTSTTPGMSSAAVSGYNNGTNGVGFGVWGGHASGGSGVLGYAAGSAGYGVYSFGDFGGTGAKYFVEPHPQNAELVIRYVSLEGPESGTYFRGRGRFQSGVATIDVPEDFRLVTDSEGLTVQVTPIGEMATVAAVRIGLDRIVVRGSHDVEFSYMVNGVRKSHRHLHPIGPGREYVPESPDARLPVHLTDGQKAMLISNGTYNADGRVNLETARRLGWDRIWLRGEGPVPSAAP